MRRSAGRRRRARRRPAAARRARDFGTRARTAAPRASRAAVTSLPMLPVAPATNTVMISPFVQCVGYRPDDGRRGWCATGTQLVEPGLLPKSSAPHRSGGSVHHRAVSCERPCPAPRHPDAQRRLGRQYAELAQEVRVLDHGAAPTPAMEEFVPALFTGAGYSSDRAGTPVLCADRAAARNPETYFRDIQAHRVDDDPQHGAGADRGADGDPATPYAGQLAMHRALRGPRMGDAARPVRARAVPGGGQRLRRRHRGALPRRRGATRPRHHLRCRPAWRGPGRRRGGRAGRGCQGRAARRHGRRVSSRGVVGVAEVGEGVGLVVAVAEVPVQVEGLLVAGDRPGSWWPRWWWA